MAEETDSGSKTEDASPRKLEEARKRGEVPKSQDVVTFASLAAVSSVLLFAGGGLAHGMIDRLRPFISRPDDFDMSNGGGMNVLRLAAAAAAPSLMSVLGGAILAGVAANLIQTGFLLTTGPLTPNLDRLSPLHGFKRLFGIDGLVQFLKSTLKIAVVGAIAWFMVAPHAREFELLPALDPLSLLPMAVQMLRGLLFAVLAFLALVAGFDWFWQRYRFNERMKMTKEELKEDFKQSEGDPRIKARIRQLRQERARRRMMQQVPKATVVVMNPTHYAVALRYEAGETAAPICVAKGLDTLALRIREVAEAHRVPVIEDPPLARALYATVEIDDVIPRQHYDAVAKIIGFILQTAKARRSRL
jgi:flagellar biosynthetic protein FlhB